MQTKIMLTLLFILCASFLYQVHADEVDEFNLDSDGWKTSPSYIGRSSEQGWDIVPNDGEKAIRNSPTTTRATYYWKMSKVLDLTHISEPLLDIKYHFKGHQYDYMQVRIGDENARRLSDFETLYQQDEATAAAQDINIDLSAYAGQIVKVQILLRKPYDVVERRIGLYVHRVALRTPQVPLNLEDDPTTLKIAAFNIQVFGLSKMDKPEVVNILLQILQHFDLVFIQEIRDVSETAIYDLLNQLNAQSSFTYDLTLSPRLGRTISKEQYAILYKTDRLLNQSEMVLPDPGDLFERPPYQARFEHISTGYQFTLLGTHLDPDAVSHEIESLYTYVDSIWTNKQEDEGVIVMGDLNADCRYLSLERQTEVELLNTLNLIQQIGSEDDTTTTSTHCAYDRLMVDSAIDGSKIEAGVFAFDQVLSLTSELTRQVSDHFPVWIQFNPQQALEYSDSPMAGTESE